MEVPPIPNTISDTIPLHPTPSQPHRSTPPSRKPPTSPTVLNASIHSLSDNTSPRPPTCSPRRPRSEASVYVLGAWYDGWDATPHAKPFDWVVMSWGVGDHRGCGGGYGAFQRERGARGRVDGYFAPGNKAGRGRGERGRVRGVERGAPEERLWAGSEAGVERAGSGQAVYALEAEDVSGWRDCEVESLWACGPAAAGCCAGCARGWPGGGALECVAWWGCG
ncbi:hypothetical protein GJ744_007239 [Endocarpon pusillum]|uniref:Uncharacterized protein n=1 Tax=Endocarpon pusillum TaxID=364733 RepID=A0A8H7AIW3_9EURO|nr:hypothetical protein GJ744_007239 [Endocarpon pusillum]